MNEEAEEEEVERTDTEEGVARRCGGIRVGLEKPSQSPDLG